MGTYHYVACHDCRVYGMLPKTHVPERWYTEWIEQFGHATHRTEFADEYDWGFEATVNGKVVVGVGWPGEPITEPTGQPPYKRIDDETMKFEWRDESD